MPTILTHAAVGLGLGQLYSAPRKPWLFWVTIALLPIVPDLDAIPYALYPWGVRFPSYYYGAHRGLSHSLVFAALVSLLATIFTNRWLRMNFREVWAIYFLATASHGILDAFTNGGGGILFFWPIDDARYKSPWQPIDVVLFRDRSTFFGNFFERLKDTAQQDIPGTSGWDVFRSELLWVWLPLGILVLTVALVRRMRGTKHCVSCEPTETDIVTPPK